MLTFGEFAGFLERSSTRVRPAMLIETEHLMHEVAERAKALIGNEHPEWPPLAESTIRDKERKGYAVPAPLLRTGDMRASIGSEVALNGAGAEGVVGSNSDIALYQEMGTRHIPPRPFMGLAMIKAEPRAEEEFGHLAVELLTPALR